MVSGIQQIWEKTLGDRGLTVAVIDGPVDLRHPCFAGASLDVADVGNPSSCQAAGPQSCAHGTHVTSILFAQHGKVSGLNGIAPACHGLIIPIFQDDPHKNGQILPVSQGDLAKAIDLARRSGAQIVNISGGQLSNHGRVDTALSAAVRHCLEQGVLIVGAAGNDGCDCLHVPASLPGVLAVGAAAGNGAPAAFSNYGQAYRKQGLLAPGHNIPGASPGGGIAYHSGTSFAAPIVSGVAALLLSLKRPRSRIHTLVDNPSAVPRRSSGPSQWPATAVREVRRVLMASAKPCQLDSPVACKRFLGGTLDVRKAFHLTLNGDTTMDAQSTENRRADAPLDTIPSFAAQDRAALELSSCACETGQDAQPGAPQTPEEDEEVRQPAATRASALRTPLPSSPIHRSRSSLAPSSVRPSCECENAGPLVYALGEIGYDFGTLARQDSIVFEMDEGTSPLNPAHVVAFLRANPHFAPSFIWTLNLDGNPIYAIKPDGTFSREAYARIVSFYEDQIKQESERAAIPGTIKGQITLYSGQVVPVICPEYRGMTNWSTAALRDACGVAARRAREAAAGKPDTKDKKAPTRPGREDDESFLQLENFLNRIYFELRNMGAAPQERALNYAATNAFVPGTVIERVAKLNLLLDEIEVEQSPICRKDSDCWDVKLIFFDSKNVLASRYLSRFTVDVSDVVPVIVGTVREWNIR